MVLKGKSSDVISEVKKIVFAEPGKSRQVYYDAELVINPKFDKNGKKEVILKCEHFSAVDIKRDYGKSRTDITTAIFQMPLGDTVKVIYPDRDNIIMRLTRYARGGPKVNDYRCLITKVEDNIKNEVYTKESLDRLNEVGMSEISVQLVSPLSLQLKKHSTSGVYKNQNIRDAMVTELHGMMKEECKKINVGKWKVVALPHDNSRKYEHIIIPSGTKTMDVPQIFQKGEQGVYNGDINTYLQEYDGSMNLYVYPLYRPTHGNYKQPKLIIYGIRDAWNGKVDATWAIDEHKNLQIVGEPLTRIHDDDSHILDRGNEIKVSDSETSLARPFKVTYKKLIAIPDAVVRTYKNRKVAYDAAPITTRRDESNNFDLRSGVLADDLIKMQVRWKYSDYTSIHPVMPVEYIEETKDGVVHKYEGVINAADVFTNMKSKTEETVLMLLLKRRFDKKSQNVYKLK